MMMNKIKFIGCTAETSGSPLKCEHLREVRVSGVVVYRWCTAGEPYSYKVLDRLISSPGDQCKYKKTMTLDYHVEEVDGECKQ